MPYRVSVSLSILLTQTHSSNPHAQPTIVPLTNLSGLRIWNDTPPNAHPLPCPLHADCGANARLPDNNSCSSLGTRQIGPWERISGFLHQSAGGAGFGVVLDRVVVAAGGPDWVWRFLPERTVEQGVKKTNGGGAEREAEVTFPRYLLVSLLILPPF